MLTSLLSEEFSIVEIEMEYFFLFTLSFIFLLFFPFSSAQMPGFVSLDCGGDKNFTDEIGLKWTPDDKITYGEISTISVANETRKQYMTLRHFPADSRKYCYTLDVVSRTRYLLRATFLYGNFDNNNVYPKFDISIGATDWSTIVISDANTTESDSVKKANYLVDVAYGTKKISTNVSIDINREEMPPVKVMQTAVVGTNGSLTYRLNLDGFPAMGRAFSYLAEIEDFPHNESRKFRLVLPGQSEISKAVVNIEENALGKYRVYEPGFNNLSLPFVMSFKLAKTSDSSKGPLLNAMEINKYLEKNDGSPDGEAISSVLSHYSSADWAQEGGDPCLPVPWSWVRCSSDQQPRIVSILLSGKNMTGDIPLDITKLTGLVELWLDGNMLTGPIPDFTGCMDLKIIHLENNQLAGVLPASLGSLPNLKELYVQNNRLSGTIPSELLSKYLLFNYSGNNNLNKGSRKNNQLYVIIGSAVGAAILLLATIISCLCMHKGKRKYYDQDHLVSLSTQNLESKSDGHAEVAHCFSFSEIESSTNNFEKKIGSGGFGVVYYGKQKDGREIAVKVLTSNSYQGKKEFSNEVSSRPSLIYRVTFSYYAL
ncbi:hypothetical protein TSUD_317310 [Trifolium subterraneum]|uniref:Protein kinase domain-containing protein n=1 Tax=Trifolium subterraneum TaxID=3900 RepID=A0A2Z6M9L0_TRISU|nr:hypothetical protein TSUD_317310 [Trifolium subterraneum]